MNAELDGGGLAYGRYASTLWILLPIRLYLDDGFGHRDGHSLRCMMTYRFFPAEVEHLGALCMSDDALAMAVLAATFSSSNSPGQTLSDLLMPCPGFARCAADALLFFLSRKAATSFVCCGDQRLKNDARCNGDQSSAPDGLSSLSLEADNIARQALRVWA